MVCKLIANRINTNSNLKANRNLKLRRILLKKRLASPVYQWATDKNSCQLSSVKNGNFYVVPLICHKMATAL